jgi:RNA polymerase sigma-B factor
MSASPIAPSAGAERRETPAASRDDQSLAILWRERSPAARSALAEHFMPLARSLARRYQRSSEPLEDLVQVAALGLLKAIDRFDPERGTSFASFAVPTILGELRRYFRDCCWAVHVPRGAQEHALQVEAAQRELSREQRRAPTVGEIAQYLELDTEQVLDGMQAGDAYGAVSLDAPRSADAGEDGETYADSLGDFDKQYAVVEYRATITGALVHLTAKEREVLQLRFTEELTQSEIAERIGVSQMQVSRLLRRALEQLRILARAPAAAAEPSD